MNSMMKVLGAVLFCVVFLGRDVHGRRRKSRPSNGRRPGCPRNYDPVCGSNGVTYANLCLLEAAQKSISDLTMSSEGACQAREECRDSSCATYVDPVCGSDGRTYSNPCRLTVAQCRDPGLTKAGNGACSDVDRSGGVRECGEICAANFDPVCGSNGRTYSNPCRLAIAQCRDPSLIKAGDGSCPDGASSGARECGEICAAYFDPVCGSNGRTYSNPCRLAIAQCRDHGLIKAGDGSCPDGASSGARGRRAASKVRGCPEVCASILSPVCGSDGTSYSNRCELERASCMWNKRIDFVREGRCEDCDKICPLDHLPVCGSDGILYGNQCLFEIQQCRDSTLTPGTSCIQL